MLQGSEGVKRTVQIGEAALRANLSIDTIRFYERRELLPPAPRTTGQFRLYTSDDIGRLTFIKQMQGLGFSLQEIKQLLHLRDRGGHACWEVRDMLNSKLEEVRRKIHELNEFEHELVVDLQKCNRELKRQPDHTRRHCPILSGTKGKK